MSAQPSRSQMEQGELISYETNLAACYEAEYLLSLQTANCQCADHHSVPPSSLTETMEYGTCQNTEMESTYNNMEEESNSTFNARKRPYHDANKYSCRTNIDVPIAPKTNNCYYNGGASLFSNRKHDNTLVVVTGQLSPHVKRMCFETQQCQS